jgi:molybdate transport system permease protein
MATRVHDGIVIQADAPQAKRARIAIPAPIGVRTERDARRLTAAPSTAPLRWLVWGAAGLLVLFLVAPLAAIVWRGVAARQEITPEAADLLREAITLSLVTSSVSICVIVALGTPLAYLLARRSFRGARVLDALVDLPIVLPPAVAGIALLIAFGRYGVVGRWLNEVGITVGFTSTAVVLAQTFIAAPFFIRASSAGFTRVDRDLEDAASDLGASPGKVFRTVTLPMAFPSLLAGAMLAWARALGEFGATIMFAGNFPGVTQTMPLAIYARFGAGDLSSALLLSLALLVFSLIVLIGLRMIGGRAGAGSP